MMGRISGVFAELGSTSALLYLVHRGLAKLGGFAEIYHYVLVAQPIPDGSWLGPRRGRSIEVRLVSCGDPALAQMPLDETVLRHRFGQGALCFGAFQDGQMIGCQWLCLGQYEEDEVRSRFVPRPEGRTAWDFDVYVLPELRQGLAFGRLWDTTNAYLRKKGVGWSFSRISGFNAKSLASHYRLGAQRVGTATYVRFGDWQLMLATVRPYVHLSSKAGDVPTIQLRAPGS